MTKEESIAETSFSIAHELESLGVWGMARRVEDIGTELSALSEPGNVPDIYSAAGKIILIVHGQDRPCDAAPQILEVLRELVR